MGKMIAQSNVDKLIMAHKTMWWQSAQWHTSVLLLPTLMDLAEYVPFFDNRVPEQVGVLLGRGILVDLDLAGNIIELRETWASETYTLELVSASDEYTMETAMHLWQMMLRQAHRPKPHLNASHHDVWG